MLKKRQLSEVPFKEVKIGLKVLSEKNIIGEVIGLYINSPNKEDNEIEILWESGKRTIAWHCWLCKVSVIE
jgi:hypothetical protein